MPAGSGVLHGPASSPAQPHLPLVQLNAKAAGEPSWAIPRPRRSDSATHHQRETILPPRSSRSSSLGRWTRWQTAFGGENFEEGNVGWRAPRPAFRVAVRRSYFEGDRDRGQPAANALSLYHPTSGDDRTEPVVHAGV